jgi:hypothetical protein
MAVTMKNVIFWDVIPCGSEEHRASIIRVTRIGELGTTVAVTTTSSSSQHALVASYI